MRATDTGTAWLAAMRRGDFAAAWAISDQVLAQRVAEGPSYHWPRHLQWIWNGAPLHDRRVLVRCYHGLGDTIQFARFLPGLSQTAAHVSVWAQPALLRLLGTMHVPRLTLLPLHDGTPDLEYDVDIESMELPHALRITLETLPNQVPYLCVPAAKRHARGFSVGLVMQAGDWDPNRSVPPGLTQRLTSVPGVAWFNLQLDDPIARAEDISTPDVFVLAQRLRALDLVITVDTMLAHLAGALAVPVWTLLPFQADWRWMEQRPDSPWYPTMRLFRQPRPGAWEAVLDDVAARLASAVT